MAKPIRCIVPIVLDRIALRWFLTRFGRQPRTALELWFTFRFWLD